ncbi:TPA: hypothetical protein ACGOZD_000326 [Streptococcus suis]
MILKTKILSIKKSLKDGSLQLIVTQKYDYIFFPSTLYKVTNDFKFDVKVGQWVYIDSYTEVIVGIV